MNTSKLPFFIGITGPTASGKTDAALSIAAEIPCEIISVDSALIYQGMDIGTAKPTRQERYVVPHHLIDIRLPHQTYSVAEFVAEAHQLIRDIHSRNLLPLLVGGTMMYFKMLATGLDALPMANEAIRKELSKRAEQYGWPALHKELMQVDSITGSRLASNDGQRIQRALEVYHSTGQIMSSFHKKNTAPDHSYPLISLEPNNRLWLHERIEQRLHNMMNNGFMNEVRHLKEDSRLHADLPSIRCVGYRQAWAALDGKIPMNEIHMRAVFATRQLAKRQITWLRSMPNRHVIACDEDGVLKKIKRMLDDVLFQQYLASKN
jgi:tRNA dimethylallyltransferase